MSIPVRSTLNVIWTVSRIQSLAANTRVLLAVLLSALNLVCPALTAQSAPAQTPATRSNAAGKTVDGWKISQWSKLYGEQVVTISAIGIKSTNPRTAVTLVMTPPFKIVTVFNDQGKSIFQTPIELFRCPLLKTFAILNSTMLGESPMIKIGTGTLNGFKIVKYKTTKDFTAHQAAINKQDDLPVSSPMSIESQSTNDFHLAPGAGVGLCRLYGIPVVPGIPLEVNAQDMNLNPVNYLHSRLFTKTTASTADFALPTGYRPMKSVQEILQSNVTEDAMQLFSH